MNENTSQAQVPSCPHCGSKEFFRSRRSGIKEWLLRHVLFQKDYRCAALRPFTIRCGAPDCDWGHKMHDLLGEDQLRLCYSEFRKHCIQRHDLQEWDYIHLDLENWLLTLVKT